MTTYVLFFVLKSEHGVVRSSHVLEALILGRLGKDPFSTYVAHFSKWNNVRRRAQLESTWVQMAKLLSILVLEFDLPFTLRKIYPVCSLSGVRALVALVGQLFKLSQGVVGL